MLSSRRRRPVLKYPRSLLKKIRLAVFDFDGVFTDNRVFTFEDGREGVCCWRSDGFGLQLLKECGIETLVISTETNPVVSARCKKLKINCLQGCADKLTELKKQALKRGLGLDQVAFIGNDINDIDCLRNVGLPVCVSDAYPQALQYAKIVTKARGGFGAVREFCELMHGAYNE